MENWNRSVRMYTGIGPYEIVINDRYTYTVSEEIANMLNNLESLELSDIEKQRCEIKNKIKVLERRLDKTLKRRGNIIQKQRGETKGPDSLRSELLDSVNAKRSELLNEIESLRHEYGILIAIEAKVPEKYILNSRVYGHNDITHILLGYYDPKIGAENHGHMVIDGFGECVYMRLPFGRHLSVNSFSK